MNKHEWGMYVGRFQPFHKGHLNVVRNALEHCDKLVIVIGSAQECGTKKNPYSWEVRKEIIRRSLRGLGKRVVIIAVADREEIHNDSGWGRYLLDEIYAQLGIVPTINFEGHEDVRSTWFKGIDIERQEIARDNISATAVRDALERDDRYLYEWLMPTSMWSQYGLMRKVILEVEDE